VTIPPALRARAPMIGSVAILMAITLLVFRHQVFQAWTFPWDFLGTYTTTPPFVAASVSTGHLFSWTPFVASGFPVGVNVQAELYYPVWWLFGVLGIPLTLTAMTGVQIAHVLLGALGVLALARARRLAWPWALCAAAAYLMFGGFYGESEHADIVRGFGYLPWLLWALTPPEAGRWLRLLALPPLAWLIASGAYPGDAVSYGIVGAVYVAVALRKVGWRRHALALALAVASSGAIALVVLLPYLLADHAHQLYRAAPPTAPVRAGESFGLIDVLGLYLNPFAWTYDGSVTSWAIGAPVLIGLACLRRATLRHHLPLVIAGAVALALATTPKIGFIGKAMVSLSILFPSRFPAADYKAAVVIALIILAAEAWSDVASGRVNARLRAPVAGVLLIVGAVLAPSTYAQPTRTYWLLALVIAATVVLALSRPRALIFVCLLLSLIVIDGYRAARDELALGKSPSWLVSASSVGPQRARDAYIRNLPERLLQAVPERPARTAAIASVAQFPTGTNDDSLGWIADGYRLTDYGDTIERSRWQVQESPTWSRLMLASWSAYTFPCAQVGCHAGAVRLPAPSSWHPSPAVRTLRYGTNGITYAVDVRQPTLMVENELSVDGWRASLPGVRLLDAGIPLRAWRLPAGRYVFTARFEQPGRGLQELAAVAAFLLWLACTVAVLRRTGDGSQPETASDGDRRLPTETERTAAPAV
jgi:hypothetical protein